MVEKTEKLMKTVAIIQARLGSTRLPGKVLSDIAGQPALWWIYQAAHHAHGVDEVIIATTTLPQDDAIYDWCSSNGIKVFRGSETDVLSRFMGAAIFTDATVIIRLTGDCPLHDPVVIGEVVKLRAMTGVAYASNTEPGTYPDGLDTEVFTREALECANREANRATDRDTVTRFLVRNRGRFPSATLTCPLPGLHKERWVMDTADDLKFVREVAKRLGEKTPPSYLQVLSILEKEPHLREINAHHKRNERFYEGLAEETGIVRSFTQSKLALARAENTIPLGAQTYSKSKLQFPGDAPLFVTHGDGAYVYDVDGNDYVDLVGGLLPVVLGYRDPDVDRAIRDQLSRGISFSLATPLEAELSERLCKHIPCAEMARFGKNGSDVTTAAVRLARHVASRDLVLQQGYHGWHSWTTSNIAGVPPTEKEDSGLYLNDEALEGVAAVIIEPEGWEMDDLLSLRKRCSALGTLLIFDEIITGFRCGISGIQGVTGVIPDLACYGKAMANGMPISALVGKEKYMKRMPEIAYSGTFFGETLSIAAAIATIDKLERENIPRKLNIFGSKLRSEIKRLIIKHDVEDRIKLYSEVELNRIKFADDRDKALFIHTMAKEGVLIIGSHNISAAHGEPELQRILKAYDRCLYDMADNKNLDQWAGQIRGKSVR